jgi:hypothetical protein
MSSFKKAMLQVTGAIKTPALHFVIAAVARAPGNWLLNLFYLFLQKRLFLFIQD